MTAIAEALGVNVIVEPITQGVKGKPICLYRAEKEDAPTLHLYNRDNNHWFVNNDTLGDGNCLYNAVIQGLQHLVAKEIHLEIPVQASMASTSNGFFERGHNHEAIEKHQRAIAEAISSHPTPAELETQLAIEKERNAKLPRHEQEQIHNDYLYALQLAAEEMNQPASRFRL